MTVKRVIFFAVISITPYASYAQDLLSIPLNNKLVAEELRSDLNIESAYAIIEVPQNNELRSMGYIFPNVDMSYLNNLEKTNSINPTAKIDDDAISQIMSEAYQRYGIPAEIIPAQELSIIVNDRGPVQAPGGGHEPFPNIPLGGQPSGPSNPPSGPVLGNNDASRSIFEMFRANESNVFAVEQ